MIRLVEVAEIFFKRVDCLHYFGLGANLGPLELKGAGPETFVNVEPWFIKDCARAFLLVTELAIELRSPAPILLISEWRLPSVPSDPEPARWCPFLFEP